MAKRKTSVWARLGLGLGLVLALLVAALGALAVWLPTTGVSTDLAQTLSRRLGRQVGLDGGVRLSVWPVLGVEAHGLTIANIPGGRAAHLIEAEAVDVGVAPLDLLRGKVSVDRVLLRAPVLRLEKLADGRVNWTLATNTPEPAGRSPGWLKDLRLSRMLVERGAASYFDGASGATQGVTDFGLTLSLASLDTPLHGVGKFTWHGRPVSLDIGLAQPRALLDGRPGPIVLTLASDPLNLKLDGQFAPATGVLTGAVDARGPSLRGLSAWAGRPMGGGAGLGAFFATGHLTRQDQTLTLESARFGLDHLRAAGDLTFDLSRPRLTVTGRLALGALDLNPYLGPPGAAGSGWSTSPINLSGLSAFDGDLDLTAGQVAVGALRVSGAALHLALTGGAADAQIGRMGVYGGGGSGRVLLSQGAGGARIAVAATLSGVQIKPLLQAVMKSDRVEGAGQMSVNVTGAGGSQAQIMRSLSGRASVLVSNGALLGVNLGAVSTQIQSSLGGGAVGSGARTPFSSAGADFGIAGGVASTQNLKVAASPISLGGVGRIDIGGQSLDMAIKPAGSMSLAGRGLNLGAVPFRVHGPWTRLSYEPDLKGLAEAQLKGQLTGLTGGDGGALGGLLQGLGGGQPSAQPSTAPTKKPQKAPAGLPDVLGGLIPH